MAEDAQTPDLTLGVGTPAPNSMAAPPSTGFQRFVQRAAVRHQGGDPVAKAYDPNEPRDAHGRWTTGGGHPAPMAAAVPVLSTQDVLDELAATSPQHVADILKQVTPSGDLQAGGKALSAADPLFAAAFINHHLHAIDPNAAKVEVHDPTLGQAAPAQPAAPAAPPQAPPPAAPPNPIPGSPGPSVNGRTLTWAGSGNSHSAPSIIAPGKDWQVFHDANANGYVITLGGQQLMRRQGGTPVTAASEAGAKFIAQAVEHNPAQMQANYQWGPVHPNAPAPAAPPASSGQQVAAAAAQQAAGSAAGLQWSSPSASGDVQAKSSVYDGEYYATPAIVGGHAYLAVRAANGDVFFARDAMGTAVRFPNVAEARAAADHAEGAAGKLPNGWEFSDGLGKGPKVALPNPPAAPAAPTAPPAAPSTQMPPLQPRMLQFNKTNATTWDAGNGWEIKRSTRLKGYQAFKDGQLITQGGTSLFLTRQAAEAAVHAYRLQQAAAAPQNATGSPTPAPQAPAAPAAPPAPSTAQPTAPTAPAVAAAPAVNNSHLPAEFHSSPHQWVATTGAMGNATGGYHFTQGPHTFGVRALPFGGAQANMNGIPYRKVLGSLKDAIKYVEGKAAPWAKVSKAVPSAVPSAAPTVTPLGDPIHWPASVASLTLVNANLGGGGGLQPRTMQAPNGGRFVVKGVSVLTNPQVANELDVNRVYAAAGVPALPVREYQENGVLYQVSPWLPGGQDLLATTTPGDPAQVAFAKGLAVDALVGAWDVVKNGNTQVFKGGVVLRLDNGCGLDRASTGVLKNEHRRADSWSAYPVELFTLRNPKIAKGREWVYDGLNWDGIADQIRELAQREPDILQAVRDPGKRAVVAQRLQVLKHLVAVGDGVLQKGIGPSAVESTVQAELDRLRSAGTLP